MRHEKIAFTTNGSGAVTASGTRNILGKLYAILYQPNTIATGATVTVTSEGVTSRALLTKASAGTADTMYYPRDLVHAVADGSALTGTSGGDRVQPLINGTLQVVIASGGATLSGSITVYWED